MSQTISDRDTLEGIGSAVFPLRKELRELVPDLLGHRHGLDLNLIASNGILALGGDVLDKHDSDITTDHDGHDSGHVLLSLFLPDSSVALGNSTETGDDEVIFVADVLVVLCQLCVDGDLVLHDAIQAAMVLLDCHHSIFQDTRAFAVLKKDILWLTGERVDQC